MANIEEIFKEITKKPSLDSFKEYLFVGPHPDDIEFGCGALISKLHEMGAHIHFLIVTDGGAGTKDKSVDPTELVRIRKEESISSANFLGAETIDFLGFEDAGMYSDTECANEICKYILKYRIDVVFAPDPKLVNECHPDHIKCGNAVREAIIISGYPIALKRHNIDITSYDFFPKDIHLVNYFTDKANVVIDVSEKNINEKLYSISLHKSQNDNPEGEMLMGYFKYKSGKLGQLIGKDYAEDYYHLIPLMQHVYSDKTD